MKVNLKIIKPKTRPIQVEPWFFRYLNEGQLKVVSAILAHADYSNRQKNSFPSNAAIAFYCGFGLIAPNSKTEETYNKLSDEEKVLFKAKRMSNAKATVKNIKKQLEDLGLLKREHIGKPGKQQVYYVIDLEWKKEQFLKEHDKFFNNAEVETVEEDETITQELEKLTQLHEDGNISKASLANRLQDLSHKVKANNYDPNKYIPVEDIDKVADYYMNTDKIKNKLDMGDIKTRDGYRQSIVNSIKNSEFAQAQKIYNKLIDDEYQDIISCLTEVSEQIYPTRLYKDTYLFMFNNKIKLIDDVFVAEYKYKDVTKDFLIDKSMFEAHLMGANYYTTKHRKMIENYEENVKKLVEKMKNEDVKNE